MRKVYIEIEATVLVPVRVKGSIIVRADEDADIDKAVERWTKGKPYGKADIEEDPGEKFQILRIGDQDSAPPPDDYETNDDLLHTAAGEALHQGKGVTLHESHVIDSK